MTELDAESIAAAVASGATDRVNDVLDAIEDRDPERRAELFDQSADRLVEVYREADDGYVRQAVVRALDAMYSVGVRREDSNDADIEGERSIRFVEFLFETLCDEDGRVRNSAVRAFGPLCVGCLLADDEALLEAAAERLAELREETDGAVREDVDEAHREVTRYLGPIGEGIKRSADGALEGFEERE